MNIIKKYIKYLPIFLFLFVVSVSIYTIGSSNLFAPDEYNYSNIYDTTQPITSFSDLRISLDGFYNNWTGRILVHGAIQLFLWLNINAFYVLNGIVFSLFLIGIIRLFKNKVTILNLSVSLFLIIFCTMAFCEKYIWVSGSLNYLWPTCFMLYTLAFFYNGIIKKKKYNFMQTILFWILAFITGFSQENTAFVTGSFIIVLVLTNIKYLLKLPLKEKIYWILSILIFGIGAMLLIFAPGNFVRLNSTASGKHLYIINTLKNVFHIQNLIVIYIILFIAVFLKEKNAQSQDSKKTLTVTSEQIKYVILPNIIAILPMFILSEFYDRAMLPYETLILAGIIYSLSTLLKNTSPRSKINLGATVIFTFCSLYPLFTNYAFCVKYLKPYKNQFTNQIETQINEGISTLVVNKFEHISDIPVGNMICENYLDSLSNDFRNQFAARYYHVAGIYCVPTDFCHIEITTDIETTDNFYVVNKDNVPLAYRYINSKYPVSSLANKIIFELPISQLPNAILVIPEEIQEHITSIEYREVGKIETLDKSNLNFGGAVLETTKN